jgi:carbonic anhydrase
MLMSLETLLERNKAFEATDARAQGPAIPFIPNQLAYVITCIDPRTEPAGFLGVELGDAIVQRAVGGRVTPAVLRDVAYISYLLETKAPDGPWFELAVIHHTDCGSTFLADPQLRAGFAARGYDEAELAALPVIDPAATVREDVAKIIAAPQVSSRIRVSGHVYDVKTGHVTTVVPATAR